MTSLRPDIVICADWSKSKTKRAIWLADLRDGNAVRRLDISPRTFGALIHEAKALASSKDKVLVTFDAPLGLPRSYFEAARARTTSKTHNFLDWLSAIPTTTDDIFKPACKPDQWSISRPFFRVLKGKGGLKAFEQVAAAQGIALRRYVDCHTRAKSMFVMGIPGQVACAAQELWREMAHADRRDCGYKVWPFDGPLERLLSRPGITVGEIYPAKAYAIAIGDIQQQLLSPEASAPTGRRVRIVKSSQFGRRAAITALKQSVWIQDNQVTIQDLMCAEDNDDDFDACMTTAALLRLVLERRPLASQRWVDPVSEGGMLCV